MTTTTESDYSDLDEVQRKLKEIFLRRTHWAFVFDNHGAVALEAIRVSHYKRCLPEDFAFGEINTDRGVFGLIMARKDRMPAPALSRLLRQVGAADMTVRELCERDLLVIARPGNLTTAAWIAETLLSDAGDPAADLGMAA